MYVCVCVRALVRCIEVQTVSDTDVTHDTHIHWTDLSNIKHESVQLSLKTRYSEVNVWVVQQIGEWVEQRLPDVGAEGDEQ